MSFRLCKSFAGQRSSLTQAAILLGKSQRESLTE